MFLFLFSSVGDEYYRMSNRTLSVRSGYPRKNTKGFLQCPKQNLEAIQQLNNMESSSSSSTETSSSLFTSILFVFYLLICLASR